MELKDKCVALIEESMYACFYLFSHSSIYALLIYSIYVFLVLY